MDNITLNELQLKKLRQYIHNRGIKDPVIAMEVLDHFACKVEEEMTQNPQVSLEEAMVAAHKSFGIKGFRAITEYMEKGLHKKYRKLFWTNFLKQFTSIPSLLLFIAVCLFVYEGNRLFIKEELFFWEDKSLFSLLLIVLYAVIEIVITYRVIPKFKTNLYVSTAVSQSSFFGIYLVLFLSPSTTTSIVKLVVTAVFCGIYTMLLLARWQLYKKAMDEYQEFEENYQQVQ
ncbi:MAG: hypothetical protein R2800_04535 [Flavipsychrobacter sp.]